MKISLKFWLFLFLSLFFFLFACTISPYDTYNQGSTSHYDPNNPYGNSNGPNSPYGNSNDPNNPYGNSNGPNSPYGNSNDPNNPYGNSNDPNNPYAGPQNPGGAGNRSSDFPYELIPDTLTAVTCPNFVRIAGRPFTLNLGAYVNHGLQLSNNFKENNDITRGTDPQKVRQLLERSPFKNANARLALQDESDLRIIYGKGNSQGLLSYFPRLNNPSTLDHLSRLIPVFTTRSSSVSAVGRGGKFEALLPITGQDLKQYAEGLAPANQGVHILTLTYTMDGKRPILSDTGLPYGRGYKIEFNDIYNADYLVDVQEDRLETTEKEGEWNCPPHLSFPIHHAESKESSPFNIQYPTYRQRAPDVLPEGYCYTGNPDSLNLNRSHQSFFKNVFGTSELDNLPFKVGKTVLIEKSGSVVTDEICIKFKRHGCYPQNYFRIEFDRQKECFQFGNLYTEEERYSICPGFLSVCYRYIDE